MAELTSVDLFLIGAAIFSTTLFVFGFAKSVFNPTEKEIARRGRKNVLTPLKYRIFYIILVVSGITIAVRFSNGIRTDVRIGLISMIGFAGLAMFTAGLYHYFIGFSEYRKYSLIRDTSTSKIGSVAAGTVELEGEAVGTEKEVETDEDAVLTSPFSEEDCVFYKYEVEKISDDNSDTWSYVDVSSSDERFYIDDGTGKILLNPKNAEARIPSDNQIKVNGGEKLPDNVSGFVEKNTALDSNDLLSDDLKRVSEGNRLRYTEYYISTGDDVYVFGKAVPKSDEESSTNPENLVVEKSDLLPMLVSDSPEKGTEKKVKKGYLIRLFGGGLSSVVGYGVILWVLKVI